MDFEGRESQRIDTENFLSYRLYDADDRVFDEGMVTTLDISRTGTAITSARPMASGLKVELSVAVGDDLVKTVGRVRNQKKVSDDEYQVGIEFDFLSEEDLDKLATVFPDINS